MEFFLYYFFLTQQLDALCQYLPQFSHMNLENLLFFCFICLEFSARTFYYGNFIVSCFLLTLFSRTTGFISQGPCMSSLRYSHSKILSKFQIILVGRQIHAPPSHIHLYHISLDFIELQIEIIQFIEPYLRIFDCVFDPTCVPPVCNSIHNLLSLFRHFILSMNAIHVLCAVSLNYLTTPKGMQLRIIMK